MSFLTNIWDTIKNDVTAFFTKEKPLLDDAFSKANSFVNLLKSIVSSAPFQTVTTIAELIIPGPIVPGVLAALSTFFTDFGLAAAEEAKPVEQIILDGFAKIATLTPASKTLALQNANAVVSQAIDNANGGTLTLPQASVTVPLVYNPSVLGVTAPPAAAPGVTGNANGPVDDSEQEQQ